MQTNFFSYSVLVLLFFNTVALAQSNNFTQKLTPTPVLVKRNSLGKKAVIGWKQPLDLPKNCKYAWEGDEGSKIWQEEIFKKDFNEILNAFSTKNKFSNFRVLASEKLKKTALLDSEGYGWSVIASATKNAKKYKLALLIIYGSMDDSERSAGMHVYAATEKNYITSGGWVVPATFWLSVDPKKDVGDLIKQSTKEHKEQAQIFARLSDIWIESMYNLYVQQMQANLRALHNLRISAIAAGDPNATVVPGDGGYDQIDYNY